MNKIIVKRGEIYYANLDGVIGSEQGGTRPVLIVQNNIGNRYSPTTIVICITSQLTKKLLPTHIYLDKEETSLNKSSMVLSEQIRTIDKRRLKEKVGELNSEQMRQIDNALLISLGLR
jgi:mRNA interferase MazF